MAGKGDAQSSAELAVKHDSWSKVCGQVARRLRPTVRRWRWTMREGDGQPLRLLADLTGPVLAPVVASQLHGPPPRRPRTHLNLRLGHRPRPKTTRAIGIVVMIRAAMLWFYEILYVSTRGSASKVRTNRGECLPMSLATENSQ